MIVGTTSNALRFPVRRTPSANPRSCLGERLATQAIVIGWPSPRPSPMRAMTPSMSGALVTIAREAIPTPAIAMLEASSHSRPTLVMSRPMSAREIS
jgi:hypothetical protein